MKTSAGKKLLLCFRPVIMENKAIKSDSNKNNNFPVKFKDQSMTSDVKSLKPNSKRDSTDGGDGGGGHSRKKKSARRIFSQMAKAVLIETYLKKKKIRNGKVVQDPIRSESNLSLAKIEKISKLTNDKSNRKQSEVEEEDEVEMNQTVSSSDLSSSSSSTLTHSSSISSSSSSSSSSSWLIPEPKISWISFSGRDKSFRLNSFDRRKQSNNETKFGFKSSSSSSSSNYCCIIGLCLLLFSLTVLVFWGKTCAILCTSTWFYFVSTSTCRNDGNVSTVKEKSPEVKVESKQYKKKVIMEGLLERNKKQSIDQSHSNKFLT